MIDRSRESIASSRPRLRDHRLPPITSRLTHRLIRIISKMLRSSLLTTIVAICCVLRCAEARWTVRPTTTTTKTTTTTPIPATVEVSTPPTASVEKWSPYPQTFLVDMFDRRYADGSFEYRYELSNGDTRYERGYWMPVSKHSHHMILARRGFYSYPLPNGLFLTVFYQADHRGFQQLSSNYSLRPKLPQTIDVPIHTPPRRVPEEDQATPKPAVVHPKPTVSAKPSKATTTTRRSHWQNARSTTTTSKPKTTRTIRTTTTTTTNTSGDHDNKKVVDLVFSTAMASTAPKRTESLKAMDDSAMTKDETELATEFVTSAGDESEGEDIFSNIATLVTELVTGDDESEPEQQPEQQPELEPETEPQTSTEADAEIETEKDEQKKAAVK